MAEVIVALDGPEPCELMAKLNGEAGARWFKIGPQAMTSWDWPELVWAEDVWMFLDLKLADTADTVREAVRRFADAGIAVVSTFTRRATEVAVRAAEGTPLRIWTMGQLTDWEGLPPMPLCGAQGVIGPLDFIRRYPDHRIDRIVPGVRLSEDSGNGHRHVSTPQECAAAGATHIVVGRPIWQADDPVAAYRQYAAAFRGEWD